MRKLKPKYSHLNGEQFAKVFQDKLEAMLKRIDRLRAIKAGELGVRKIWVKQHVVPEHQVGGHWRHITEGRKRKQATVRSPKLKVLNGGRS